MEPVGDYLRLSRHQWMGLVMGIVLLVAAVGTTMWKADAFADSGAASFAPAPAHPAGAAPRVAAVASPSPTAPAPAATAAPAPTAVSPVATTASGCAAALAYMAAHDAPGFQLVCPGDADGAQGLTCISRAPCAPGQRMIVIADPCPAAYMNEAHNSWVLLHNATGSPIPDGNTTIDPYGHC